MKKTMKNKRIRSTIALLCIIAIFIGFAFSNGRNSSTVYAAEVISPTVDVGDNTYTSTDKLKILEIVPDVGLAELGYLLGDDAYPVKWEDIMKISDSLTRAKLAVKWINLVKSLTNSDIEIYAKTSNKAYSWLNLGNVGENSIIQNNRKYYYIYVNNNNYNVDDLFNSNTKIRMKISGTSTVHQYISGSDTINTTNLFAYNVFGSYSMCDKISYTVKKASDITLNDIKNGDYDLIYINSGNHLSGYKELYQAMANADNAYKANTQLTDSSFYNKIGQSQNNFINAGCDLKAEVAEYIMMQVAEQNTAIMFDNNAKSDGTYTNISALYAMITCTDGATFKEMFFKDYVSGYKYQGTWGSIDVKNNKIVLTNNVTNVEIDLKSYTAIYYSVYYSDFDSAYKEKYTPLNVSETVINNIYIYNGDNSTTTEFMGSMYYNEWSVKGTTIEDAFEKYGYEEYGSKKIARTNLILYILGEFKFEMFTGELNILEIDPAGAYKYQNMSDDTAKAILKSLGYKVRLADTAFKSRIHVTSVANNEFIAMTEDINNNYDLVIFTDYNPTGYIDTSITKIYTNQGPVVDLTNKKDNSVYQVALSGNDLTEKAYNKLYSYIQNGNILVLADSIYSGDTDTVDEKSNVYKLSYNELKKQFSTSALKNVIKESEIGMTVLSLNPKPVLSITNYKESAAGSQLVATNVSLDEIADLTFSGAVTNRDPLATYTLELYLDKNGSATYEITEDEESTELIYKTDNLTFDDAAGNFSIKHISELAETQKGYLRWKLVVKNNSTGKTSDDEGAFIIPSEKVVTVKVLQIAPSSTPSLDLRNEQFQQLFKDTEAITGMKLDVTFLTAEEYESLFVGKPFSIENGVVINDVLTKRLTSGFDIVVLGFADAYKYNDISDDNGALSNLVYYIQKGNAVLMSHDVISFSVANGYNVDSYAPMMLTSNTNEAKWSREITIKLRNMAGMDRFGIMLGENTDLVYNHGYSNVLLQQYGTTSGGSRLKLYTGMNEIKTNLLTTKAQKINSGQITSYPYNIEESITVSTTHAQYFQLNLESMGDDESDDVIVWYAMTSSANDYLKYSGLDALNNYYIYSKGNITYSGAGHSDAVNQSDELKLFINTIIKAIGSANSLPEIDITNAISAGDGRYEMSVRSSQLGENNSIDSLVADYIACDADMRTNALFKRGYIFVDTNNTGVYDDGDILIKQYDSLADSEDGRLRNSVPYSIDLAPYVNGNAILKEMFNNNELVISFEAVDNSGAVGISILSVINKDLFQLN